MIETPDWLAQLGPATRACLLSGASKESDPYPVMPTPAPSDWLAEADAIIDARLAAVALRMLDDTGASGDPSVQNAKDRYLPAARALAYETMAVTLGAKGALGALNDHGIPFVVVKGPSMARFYPRADLRPFSDIDIVVPERHFPTAYKIVRAIGYRRARRARSPGRGSTDSALKE